MFNALASIWNSEKIGDLSVKLKLRMIIFASLGVAILVLGIGLYGMWRVNYSMVSTYEKSVLPLDRLRMAKSALEVDTIEPLIALKEGKISSDRQISIDEMYLEVDKKLITAKNDIQNNWSLYANGELTPEEQEMVKEIGPNIEKALKSIDNAEVAVKKKDFMGILEYVGSEMPFFLQNVPPKLDTLMQMQIIKTLEQYEDSQIIFKRILVLVVIFSALGVYMLFWITKRIDNNIVTSLDRLTANAEDLAHNKLDVAFLWNRKDEFGKLGRRIEFTREELNNLIGEIKKNAEIIAKTHDSIRQSINYARRIQMSFLPEDSKLLSNSPDSVANYKMELIKDYFIVWNPKDIIGGDCYWFEHNDDGFFIAIIDCTGHGVPGALMTFVVLSALSRAITQCGGTSNPAEILKFVNKRIKNDLSQHIDDGSSNDGMDGALIFIDKEIKTLRYAGANIPLMFMRPDSEEVEELRADKLSAGYVHVPFDAEYSNQELALEPGMRFYVTTDGIVDQVGGERSLCFGKKRLRKLLLKTRDLSMGEQKEIVMKEFFEYRGSESQRDDNTIIGFEI